MAQWRDQDPGQGSIEELEPAARPARVGTSRSARIPALFVGALLVGIVTVGVSGRDQAPRDAVPPLAAASPSPRPATADGPAPGTTPPGEPSPALTPRPGRSEPFPVEEPSDLGRYGKLRFWLVVVSDGEPILRSDLQAFHGLYQTDPLEAAWGDGVRARLFGRAGGKDAVRLADVQVPRVPAGSLDLPLELQSGVVDVEALGLRDPRGPLRDLPYELRLERGRANPRSALLVARVRIPAVIDDASAPDASAPDASTAGPSTPGADRDADAGSHADYDRAVASSANREALRRSSRCARMLDPRLGRSEANLEGCERALMRARGVAVSPPLAPAGAEYWLDLQPAGTADRPTPLVQRPDGSYEAYFPYPESWYVNAPTLHLYGHSAEGGAVSIATLPLSLGPQGQPGIPVELDSGAVDMDDPGSPVWTVTLTRGQPHGLAVLVEVDRRPTR